MNKALLNYKCAEIFFLKPSTYIFICWRCRKRFDNFNSFRTHNETHFEDKDANNEIDTKVKVKEEHLTESDCEYQVYAHISIEKLENDLSSSIEDRSLYVEKYVENNENEDNTDVKFEKETSIIEISDEKSLLPQQIKDMNKIASPKSENFSENSVKSFDSNSSFPGQETDCEESEDESFNFNDESQSKSKNYQKKTVYCPNCKYDYKSFQNHDNEKCAEVQKIIKSHENNHDTLQYEGIFLCKECPRYFDKYEKLVFHRRSHYNSGTCVICDKNFISLDRHMKSQHPGEKFETSKASDNNIEPNNSLQCSYCGKRFKMQLHLERHEINHQNDSLKCRYCGRSFKRPILLKNHIRTHTGERPFKCTECPAAFALKRNLSTHFIYKHTDDKPFECRYEGGCGKYFKTDQLRNYHEKRHNQNVEFQCEICGMDFNVKAKLRMHHKTKHLDYSERPHECRFCGKKFVRTSNLREHERSHTGEKPLKCNQCPSSFARKSSLREHKKLHSGKKQHVCKICGKAFAQLAGYSNHMKNHP